MNQFDWGNKRKEKPMKTYKLYLVDGKVAFIASTLDLVEIKLQCLGRYGMYGLAMRVEEIPDETPLKC